MAQPKACALQGLQNMAIPSGGNVRVCSIEENGLMAEDIPNFDGSYLNTWLSAVLAGLG